ncbi:unnamed protein product [Urochloa decumbens]|uniref:Uncharacterized protein n=1 Tax=Urochloa decumbens TaxID=240449 RepID=A0ABC8XLX2_9POAL
MSRRFLNLVYRDYTTAPDNLLYSVTRLDASQLFYKSAAAATAAARKKNNGSKQAPVISSIADIPEIRRLPAPTFSFQPFRSKMYHIIKGVDVFAPLGAGAGDGGRILCADGAGYAAAFDMASRSMLGMPTMNAPKGPKHVAISSRTSIPRTDKHAFAADPCGDDCDSDDFILKHVIEGDHAESLYVMDMSPGNPLPFEVLSFSSKGWIWRPLPRPPFFADRRYKPIYDPCVAVDGTTFFVSPDAAAVEEGSAAAAAVGTYRFDTVTQEWDKAGDWALPFIGKTEHVPELGVWLGLSAQNPYHLCAISSLDPPAVRHVWSDIDPPESWYLLEHALLNLGSGRFCTAKFFDVSEDIKDDDAYETAVVFTGVEVLRCDDASAGGLKMIKHKSKCMVDLDIISVL